MRFQIVELAVAEVNLYDADVVTASAVRVRYQSKRVSPLFLVAPNVDHAAVAVERKHDRSPRLAAFATVDGVSRPRRRHIVVFVVRHDLRVLHEQVVLLRHTAGRTAVRLRTVRRQQAHAVEVLLFVAEFFLPTSILLAALAVEPKERQGDERQQHHGEDDVRQPEEAECQCRLRRRPVPAGVRRVISVVDCRREHASHHGLIAASERR